MSLNHIIQRQNNRKCICSGTFISCRGINGQAVAVALKLSDNITMQIVYEGSLESKIGEDELGQRLYNLVTVK